MTERAELRSLLRELQDQLGRLRAARQSVMQADPAELTEVLRRQNQALYEFGLIDAEQLQDEQLALEELNELEVRERVNRAVRELANDEARLKELRDVLLDKLNEEQGI